MKTAALLIFLLAFRQPDAADDLQKFTVSGTLTFTEDYCGGAEPDEQTLKAYERPQPYAGAVILFRRGDHNESNQAIVAMAEADHQGRYEAKLPAGEYCIIREFQKDDSIFEKIKQWKEQSLVADEVCLLEKWTQCMQSLNVQADVTGLDFQFRKNCFLPEGIPCLEYTGPYPP